MPMTRDEARAKAAALAEAMTEEEDAALTAAALSDPDSLPLDDAALSRMRWAVDVMPEVVERFRQPRVHREPSPASAVMIDPDVLAHFQADGPGWQGRINEALRKLVKG